MVKLSALDILQTKLVTPQEFDFDNAWIPPMEFFLSIEDVTYLREIATSRKLSAKIDEKYQLIDNILTRRGFKRFSGGTNRVVYNFLEDDRFVIKVATGRVAMQDNLLEFENQAFLKPYVAKMFYTSPCGTVGFAERVMPIKNRDEFRNIADDIFDILVNKFLGRYVVEDVGTQFFMNWGIRKFSGPVLLDYPYIYKLDGKKLYCTKTNEFGEVCNGEIDYDAGFNYLICSNCGKRYLATDLRDNSNSNKIIIKGGSQMQVKVVRGDEVLVDSIKMDDRIYKDDRHNKRNSTERKGQPMVIRVITSDRDYTWSEGQVISESKPLSNTMAKFVEEAREKFQAATQFAQDSIEKITEDINQYADMQRFVANKKAQQKAETEAPVEEMTEETTSDTVVDDIASDITNTDSMTEFSTNIIKAAAEETKEPFARSLYEVVAPTSSTIYKTEIKNDEPEYHPDEEPEYDSEEEIEEYDSEDYEEENEKLELASAYGVVSKEEEAELDNYISHQEEMEAAADMDDEDEYPTEYPGDPFIPDMDEDEEEIRPNKNGRYSLQDLQKMKNASNRLYGQDAENDRYNFTHGKGKKRKDKRNKKNKKNNMIGY